MMPVLFSLLALCLLFLSDIVFQIYTMNHKRRVRQYRERRYELKELYPTCLFIDFTCPKCGKKQHTVLEHNAKAIDVSAVIEKKIQRCPKCGIPLKWRD